MHAGEALARAEAAFALADLAASAPAALPGLLQTVGQWTPTDASGAVLVFAAAQGSWIKIGKLIIAQCLVAFPVTASALPTSIGGLPFPVDNTNAARQGFVSYNDSGAHLYAWPAAGASTFGYYDMAGANKTNVSLSGKFIWATIIYPTSAPP